MAPGAMLIMPDDWMLSEASWSRELGFTAEDYFEAGVRMSTPL